MNDIERKLQVVQEALDALPLSFADNPQGKLLNLCSEFNACIGQYTIGSESCPDFFQDLYDEFEKLAKEITSTRPKFEMPHKTEQREASVITAIESVVLPAYLVYPSTSVPLESESGSKPDVKHEHSQGRSLHEITNCSRYPSVCTGNN